jgi:hypothetical protein
LFDAGPADVPARAIGGSPSDRTPPAVSSGMLARQTCRKADLVERVAVFKTVFN